MKGVDGSLLDSVLLARVYGPVEARSIKAATPRGQGGRRKRNEPARHRHGDSVATSLPAWDPVAGRPREWDVTTDVAGVVARQERERQPRGKSSPSIVRARAWCHMRAHGDSSNSAALLTLPCSPRHGMWARLALIFADSGKVSSCVLLFIMYVHLAVWLSNPGAMKRGPSRTRTVTVGWKQANVMAVLSPVIWRPEFWSVKSMHYQTCVSHGIRLLPSIIHWRVGSYASLCADTQSWAKLNGPRESAF